MKYEINTIDDLEKAMRQFAYDNEFVFIAAFRKYFEPIQYMGNDMLLEEWKVTAMLKLMNEEQLKLLIGVLQLESKMYFEMRK